MNEQAGVSIGRQEVTINRTLDAPRQAVWDAWTQPKQFASWFGTPPFRTPESRVAMDVREGGKWSATQVSEDSDVELPFGGTYLEVEEPSRLVFTFEDPTNRHDPSVETATLTLSDAGEGRTEMVFNQSGHMMQEQYPALGEGYSRFFDQLEKHLAAVTSRS